MARFHHADCPWETQLVQHQGPAAACSALVQMKPPQHGALVTNIFWAAVAAVLLSCDGRSGTTRRGVLGERTPTRTTVGDFCDFEVHDGDGSDPSAVASVQSATRPVRRPFTSHTS
jgi:hypothetical protein